MDKVVMGTMNICYPHSSNANIQPEKEYFAILKTYCDLVGEKNAILDTAYYYGNTKTEEKLGQMITYLPFNPKIATKVNPWLNNDFSTGLLGQLSRRPLMNQLNTSLHNLKVDKVDILYLHCPDYNTPIDETLETLDFLWRNDKMDHWGLSNYSLSQCKSIMQSCEKHQLNEPTYYQGMYNIICRKVEEVFPFLEEHSMEFWGYNPLAGGLLTGKYQNSKKNELPNNRFHNNSIYQNIFWNQDLLDNLEMYFPYKKEAALRHSYSWLLHNSFIKKGQHKLVLGASTEYQLKENLQTINSSQPLTKRELDVINTLYSNVQSTSPNYYY